MVRDMRNRFSISLCADLRLFADGQYVQPTGTTIRPATRSLAIFLATAAIVYPACFPLSSPRSGRSLSLNVSPPMATVLRNGRKIELRSAEVVVGDTVVPSHQKSVRAHGLEHRRSRYVNRCTMASVGALISGSGRSWVSVDKCLHYPPAPAA